MSNHRRCCCSTFCTPGYRYVQIQPVMFPDKFMAHQGEFAPPSISFWIRYQGTCDPDSQDVVVIQTFADSDDERVIRIGDTTTKFMTDLGRTSGESPEITRIGITRPGDNLTVPPSYFLGTAYNSLEPNMLPSDQFDQRDKVAFSMWHRNCFTLASEEYLTEEEWLARSDYRAVFRRSSGAPTSQSIKQQGVHIFSEQAPFQELDLIPNEYSPALHCIPNRTVGGCVFDIGDPEQYFILYDYKDYYPDQIGLVVASGDWGDDFERNNICDTMSAGNEATWPSRQYIAYRTLAPNPPNSIRPFQPDGRLTCPNQCWSLEIPKWEQVFEDDSGTACDDEPFPPGPDCGSSEFCHGSQELGENVAYGAMGNQEVLSYSDRTVEANHPVRNRLFVQGIYVSFASTLPGSESVDANSFMLSDVGSDDFEGSNYYTFTGTACERIRNGFADTGGLNFGRGFPTGVDLDPNPPSSWTDQDVFFSPRYFAANNALEFGPPWFCDCLEATNIVNNLGRLDDLHTSQQIFEGGQWKVRTPGWGEPGIFPRDSGIPLDFGSGRGEDRAIGQPQLNFP